jgi:hypothetical protein
MLGILSRSLGSLDRVSCWLMVSSLVNPTLAMFSDWCWSTPVRNYPPFWRRALPLGMADCGAPEWTICTAQLMSIEAALAALNER